MTTGIFTKVGDQLVALQEAEYEAESVLQELLAKHPELLVGTTSGESTAYLLVKREASVAVGDEPSNKGWIDHVLIDAEGIPTILEVKRSTDTRIRREVVGQMMDYAANAGAEFGNGELRRLFKERCASESLDPDEQLRELLASPESQASFWNGVDANIEAGRFRLVFVADKIPNSLARIVEFLNEQMRLTEVLAVEVQQFVDESGNHRSFVPNLIGQTTAAQSTKQQESRNWDKSSILAVTRERCGEQDVGVATRIFEWAQAIPGIECWYGSGKVDGSFVAGFSQPFRCYPFALYSYGTVEFNFQALSTKPVFEDPSVREELRSRLNEIDGVMIPAERIDKRPNIPLDRLQSKESFAKFTETMEWVFSKRVAAG